MPPKRQQNPASKSRNKRKKARDGDDSGSEVEEGGGPPNRRNQVMVEDEDDDVQAGYQDADGQWLEDIYIPPKYDRVEPRTSGERIVIEKIVCENFKSYGGVKEMGPFHKSFSAIVGPNGNGKSNIIDAMLFVFGYRAAKIRCKKVSVLIHKSELLPNLNSCAVTVHFVKIIDNGQNDDTFNMVPDSRITVTRRAHSDNSSTYCLNGKRVNFQEVASFLKGAGIDIVHNRFLILQGEVESIAQMPAKSPNGLETGLLEFLEEVIGTKRYIKSLVQLEERVEQLDYEREEKLHRVDLVEKEKQAMQEPVKKAKDFLRDQNARAKYQHQLLQYKNLAFNRKTRELNEKIAPYLEQIQELTTRLEEIKSINEARKSEFDKEEKAVSKVKSEHDKKEKEFEKQDAELVKLNEEIARANDLRKKGQKDKIKKEKEIEKLDEIPRVSESSKKDYQKRKDELEGLIAEEEPRVKQRLDKLNEKINAVLKEKTTIDENFNKWRPVRHEKKMVVEQATRDLDAYTKQDEAETQKLEQFRKDLEDLVEDIRKREAEANSSSEVNVDTLKQDLARKEQELVAVVADERKQKIDVDNLGSQVHEAKELLQGATAGSDRIYKLFFGEKEQGRLPGVYGRLKDLATIDEKFNVAATVSSHLWEHWVVDNDNTGDQCIKLLKQHGLQVQNFMCLNRIRNVEVDMRKRFDAPPESKRLFDLFQFKDQLYAVAFYKALRNTLVTQDLSVGSRIAYGKYRHRVATLRGDIIEPTGAMTGGGRQQIIGKMNSNMASRLTSSMTRQEVDRLSAEYEAAANKLQILSAKKIRLESEIFELKTQIKRTEDRIKNFQGDLDNLRRQMPLKEKRVKDQEEVARAARIDPKVMKGKEAAVKAAQAELEKVIEASQDAENAANQVAEKLENLQVKQRNEIRKTLDGYLMQKKGVEEEIEKITVDMKNYSKNKKRAEDKLLEITNEITKQENKITNGAQLRDDIVAKGAKLKEEWEEFKVKLQEAREVLTQKKESLNEFKEEEKTLAKKKVEYDTKISETTNQLKGLERQVQHNTQAMEVLVLKPIPEEEIPELKILSEEELEDLNPKELEHKLAKYDKKLQGDSPNLNILEEYKKKVETFLARVDELDRVTGRRDQFRDAFINTTANRLAEFMEGFAVISSKLKEMFRMISMGGDAELDLVDTTDPFSSGVQFSVRPARKTWKKISNLSGGEKTLSSLALIFALHYFKPSPFYVMDEIDAALDFKNVSIIANYIKERTKFTQFIIISLRSNMFELADTLLGVYKVDNMSYSIHIGVSKMMNTMKSRNGEGGRTLATQQSGEAGSSQPQTQTSAPAVADGEAMEIDNQDEQVDNQDVRTPNEADESGEILDATPNDPLNESTSSEEHETSVLHGPGAASTPLVRNMSQRRSIGMVNVPEGIEEEASGIFSNSGTVGNVEESNSEEEFPDDIVSGDADVVKRYSNTLAKADHSSDEHSSDDVPTEVSEDDD